MSILRSDVVFAVVRLSGIFYVSSIHSLQTFFFLLLQHKLYMMMMIYNAHGFVAVLFI